MAMYQGQVWTIYKINSQSVILVDLGGNMRTVDPSEIKIVRKGAIS